MTVHETALRRGASAFAFLAAITSFTPTAAFADAGHPLLTDGKAILNFHGSLPLAIRTGFTDKEQADLMIGDSALAFIGDKGNLGLGLNARLERGIDAPKGFKYPEAGYNAMISMTGIIPSDINKPIKVCTEYRGEIRSITATNQRTGDVTIEFKSLAKTPDMNDVSPFKWACKAALWPYYTELKNSTGRTTADGAPPPKPAASLPMAPRS